MSEKNQNLIIFIKTGVIFLVQEILQKGKYSWDTMYIIMGDLKFMSQKYCRLSYLK